MFDGHPSCTTGQAHNVRQLASRAQPWSKGWVTLLSSCTGLPKPLYVGFTPLLAMLLVFDSKQRYRIHKLTSPEGQVFLPIIMPEPKQGRKAPQTQLHEVIMEHDYESSCNQM